MIQQKEGEPKEGREGGGQEGGKEGRRKEALGRRLGTEREGGRGRRETGKKAGWWNWYEF